MIGHRDTEAQRKFAFAATWSQFGFKKGKYGKKKLTGEK
jgi:hypothetical protein